MRFMAPPQGVRASRSTRRLAVRRSRQCESRQLPTRATLAAAGAPQPPETPPPQEPPPPKHQPPRTQELLLFHNRRRRNW